MKEEKERDKKDVDNIPEGLFETYSLVFLSTTNPIRKFVTAIVTNQYFDRLILLAIICNSVIIGLSDYSHVNSDGELVEAGSWRNVLVARTEIIFTVLFTLECVLKVICMGFFGPKGYLADKWNWLDFVVVVTGLVSFLPEVPNISIIRTFRILRPLRALSSNPGLQSLVVAILNSIPQLLGVLVLLLFVFTLFGIAGLQLFSGGGMHTRCRLTPYPVNMSWTLGQHFDKYRCLNVPNYDVDTGWRKEDSPWSTPQDCFWPIDESIVAFCSFSNSGIQKCYHDTLSIPEDSWRWCGSNYDALGNPRFTDQKVMASETYLPELFYGFINFDNLAMAFVTIIQSITLEGWSEIMYSTQNITDPIIGALYFVFLVVFGSFFVLNLLLAVLEDNFNHSKAEVKKTADENFVLSEYLKELIKKRGFQWHLPGSLTQKHERLRSYVLSDYFTMFIMGLIVLNTVTLSLDHYPIEHNFATVLESINFILVLLFGLEMILKLLVLGFIDYFKDPFNMFDFVIVVSSIMEIIISPPVIVGGGNEGQSGGGGVSALRSFRLFRIFKLLSKWTSMKKLIEKVIQTLVDLTNFAVILVLFLYIYTLLGQQFFANRLRFDEDGYVIEKIGSEKWENAPDRPRSNFDGFTLAFTTVFQILSSENWDAVMYDTIRSIGFGGIVYTASLMYIGDYIFMNLFLAILIGNFSDWEEKVRAKKEQQKIKQQQLASPNGGRGLSVFRRSKIGVVAPSPIATPSNSQSNITKKRRRSLGNSVATDSDQDFSRVNQNQRRNSSGTIKTNSASSDLFDVRHISRTLLSPPGKSNLSNLDGRKSPIEDEKSNVDSSEIMSETSESEDCSSFEMNPGNTLGIFSPDNPIRTFVTALVVHPFFDKVVLVLIVISSITLALDNPLKDPESLLSKSIAAIDIILTVLFSLEMVLKSIAMGFIGSEHAYLRSSWNRLDFFVVIVSIISLAAFDSLKALRSLRALRGLRPLRAITKAVGLKIVVNTMFSSVTDVINVGALFFLFLYIFSVFGVSYFKGQLRSCQGDVYKDIISQDKAYHDLLAYPKSWNALNDEQKSWFGPNSTVATFDCSNFNFDSEPCCSVYADAKIVTSRTICECWGGEWRHAIFLNFDNVAYAMLAFFEMSSTEGWIDAMYAIVDSRGIDMQPIRDANLNWVYFCIFFVVVGFFLALHLFVGVVIENFNKTKAKYEGNSLFLTPAQQEWLKTQEIVRRIKPQLKHTRPSSLLAGICYDICRHQLFDTFIMTSIVANTIILSMQYFGQPTLYGKILNASNIMFAGVFTVEALIKIGGLKWKYFQELWNCFDFVIVLGTDVGVLFVWTTGSKVGLTVSILRTFRIARLLRLINGAKSINQLFNTLYLTLPGLINIGALLCLLFYIFAVMGVQLFAKIQYGGELNEYANFRSFGSAILTLIRVSTGENWDLLMHDVAAHQSGCVVDPKYDSAYCGFSNHVGCQPLNGCGSFVIFPYLIIFMLTIGFILLNLFIGVILEGFHRADESEKILKPEDFKKFADRWAVYDPHATCYITVHQLEDFVQTLSAPLGFGKYFKSEKVLIDKIALLHLHVYHGKLVHFKDVLQALSTEAIRKRSIAAGESFGSLPVEFGFRNGVAPGWDSVTNGRQFRAAKRQAVLSTQIFGKGGYSMKQYYAIRKIEDKLLCFYHKLKSKKELTQLTNISQEEIKEQSYNESTPQELNVLRNNPGDKCGTITIQPLPRSNDIIAQFSVKQVEELIRSKIQELSLSKLSMKKNPSSIYNSSNLELSAEQTDSQSNSHSSRDDAMNSSYSPNKLSHADVSNTSDCGGHVKLPPISPTKTQRVTLVRIGDDSRQGRESPMAPNNNYTSPPNSRSSNRAAKVKLQPISIEKIASFSND